MVMDSVMLKTTAAFVLVVDYLSDGDVVVAVVVDSVEIVD
jgi:hypothetical protein